MVFIIAILGLLIGSFLNVCIYRIPKGESVVITPSHCVSCGKRLKWYDLFPLFSYAFLRGKCRRCKARISPVYPVVEAVNALLWTALFYRYGLTVDFALMALLCSALIVISFIDYKHFIIPDGILKFLLIFGILSSIIGLDKGRMISSAIGFFAVSLPLWLIAVVSRGGIGAGDIKLMAVCGLFVGAKLIVLSFFAGVFAAALVSVLLLALTKKKKGDLIPLGPFLALGIIISLFVGNDILNWYFSFF